MKNALKLSHHHHSGRHRPHEHTSYFPLFIMLLITGSVLAFSSLSIQASSPPPQSESVSLSGAMPEPPPETAAVITSPFNQERFSTSPITVRGTCPPGTLIEILKNDIFAGSTLCSDEGTFEVEVDLLIGENRLRARVYNALNQPGPDSEVVTVFYDAVPPQGDPLAPLNFGDAQLLLFSDAIYRGTFPNETFRLPVEIINGTPPFALDVKWGDNSNSMVPRDNNQPFQVNHVYTRPGTYQINLQVTDAEDRMAFLSVVAIINGQPSEMAIGGAGTGSSGSPIMNYLYAAWPIFAATLAAVVSFWMGEQREKHVLASRGLLISERV